MTKNNMLKYFPKILITFFLTVFIAQMVCLFLLLAAPVASQAATDTGIKFVPQVLTKDAIGYEFNSKDASTGNIANLIKAIYNYGIGIIGILAAVVLMVGGTLWIIAGGNSSQISEAKAWIGAALTGLVLALTSYLILSTVNPALVNLTTTDIAKVGKAPTNISGCCIWDWSSTSAIGGYTYRNCKAEKDLSQDNCKTLAGDKAFYYMPNGQCTGSAADYRCGEATGSCWIGTTCKSNITEKNCISSGGVFTGESKDCSKPPAGKGSCTTIEMPQICTDNVTEENCLKTYAVFKKGEACLHCCVYYTFSPATRYCEYLLESNCKTKNSYQVVPGGRCNADKQCTLQ